MDFKKNGNSDKGFSLMEVIISVGIVAFAFVGVMAVFASNIRVEIASRDKITASYLAQESIEVVRHTRDSNWFASGLANWDDGIDIGDHLALNAVDPYNLAKGWSLKQAGNLAADRYKQRIFLVNGVFVQTTDSLYKDVTRPAAWQNTHFRRLLSIEKPDADRIKITATVYYSEDDDSNVQVVSYLYNNWYTN